MRTIVNALNNPKVLAAILSLLYIVTVALAFAIASATDANAGENGCLPRVDAANAGSVQVACSDAGQATAPEQAAPIMMASN